MGGQPLEGGEGEKQQDVKTREQQFFSAFPAKHSFKKINS